jgi:hypothetical protein
MAGKGSSEKFLEVEAAREEQLAKDGERKLHAISTQNVSAGKKARANVKWAALKAAEKGKERTCAFPVQF